MHQILEHAIFELSELHGDRKSSLQPNVLEERERAGEHPWLFTESDYDLEIPIDEEAGHSDWTYLQSALPFVLT